MKTGQSVIESQLLDAKSRMFDGHVEGSLYEASMRLFRLQNALSALSPDSDAELFRHFPVAAIAVLETHFKGTVRAIVDSGPMYLERGIALTKDRLRSVSEILPLVHRKTVTVGELVAYQLPFNSIASIEEALTGLFGDKLKTLIASARDPYQIRNQTSSPLLVADIATLWRGIALTFEQRHVLAHEAASNFVVTYDDAKSAIECVKSFTEALDAVLWNTVRKDTPLTQYEMNLEAGKRYKESRTTLAATLRMAWKIAKEDSHQTMFYDLHKRWRSYVRDWVRWQGEQYAMGSIRPLIVANAYESLFNERAKDLSSWMSSARPECISM